jgi:putative transposase
VLSLVDRKRGRPEGHRALDEKREEIIRATISAHYLKQTRPTVSQLVRDVQTNCISAGLKPPHRRTIVARLEDIDLKKRARRRGEQKIVKATTPVPGLFGASRPLEVVQMDHTKADVFVVDEETRQPLGRPWLTLAMDVCSRMVTGFLSHDGGAVPAVDQPVPVALRLRQIGMVERTRGHGAVARRWAAGHCARRQRSDFRSRAFKRGCQDAGIAIEWRPPGEPRFGGHIERLIGTQMGRLHLLPGTTFSNEQELGDYDSKRHAALTLRELERYIALDIVGSYHQSIHSAWAARRLLSGGSTKVRFPLRLPQGSAPLLADLPA